MLFIIILTFVFISAFMAYASFDITSGVYVRVFCRKQTKEKQVALTFDDGPHPEYTPQVLDILKQYQIQAIFFVIGQHIAGNEELIKRIIAEGHQIGNHSNTHKSTFPLLGAKKMAADLLQCEQTIRQVTNSQTEWFRPPFGVTNPNVAKAVKIRNYKVAGWSIRSLDTMEKDKDKIVRRAVSRLRPGAIILLHDHLSHAPYVLKHVIEQAVEKGYSFYSL